VRCTVGGAEPVLIPLVSVGRDNTVQKR
jgi:hypothetical protein